MAPEVLINNTERPDCKADIWSLGVLLYELLASDATSVYPFDGETKDELQQSVSLGQYCLPDTLSPYCVDFLHHCLQQNPETRATATQLLNHPFIAEPFRHQRQHFLENFGQSLFEASLKV